MVVIEGTKYEKTITNDISDVGTVMEAPLCFRCSYVHLLDQYVYIHVSNIVIRFNVMSELFTFTFSIKDLVYLMFSSSANITKML